MTTNVVLAPERLNLGCGKFPLEGWTNVDSHCPAEFQGDFREMTFTEVHEVRMSHVLEHISWRETVPVLQQIRSWMIPDGKLRLEVPDIAAILARGTVHPLWFKYVYGDQSHEGEFHRSGFTRDSLAAALTEAGWDFVAVWAFESQHKGREGMPCLEAE